MTEENITKFSSALAWKEFANNTTVHGVRYLFSNNSPMKIFRR